MNWECPFCNHKQTATEANRKTRITNEFGEENSLQGKIYLQGETIVCQNAECRQTSLTAKCFKKHYVDGEFRYALIQEWKLWPESSALPQPDYIPKPITEDYYEACRIINLSPKASATLARRALQGMLRDFGQAKGNTLYHEIEDLSKKVAAATAPREIHPDTIDVIHAIREIGNIGAHMEKDVNTIVDVTPEEANALIKLVELLFKEWYQARETRKTRLAETIAIADAKKKQKAKPAT